jgi:hypothetical protein
MRTAAACAFALCRIIGGPGPLHTGGRPTLRWKISQALALALALALFPRASREAARKRGTGLSARSARLLMAVLASE